MSIRTKAHDFLVKHFPKPLARAAVRFDREAVRQPGFEMLNAIRNAEQLPGTAARAVPVLGAMDALAGRFTQKDFFRDVLLPMSTVAMVPSVALVPVSWSMWPWGVVIK